MKKTRNTLKIDWKKYVDNTVRIGIKRVGGHSLEVFSIGGERGYYVLFTTRSIKIALELQRIERDNVQRKIAGLPPIPADYVCPHSSKKSTRLEYQRKYLDKNPELLTPREYYD